MDCFMAPYFVIVFFLLKLQEKVNIGRKKTIVTVELYRFIFLLFKNFYFQMYGELRRFLVQLSNQQADNGCLSDSMQQFVIGNVQ